MRLTEKDLQEIIRIKQDLEWHIGQQEITAENAAAALQEHCGSLNYENALDLCSRIRQSAEEFYRLCEDREALKKADYAETLLERITENMSREQRKGFYLQALDSFRKNEAGLEETAGRAALSEEELKELVADAMRAFSGRTASEMSDVLEDPCFWCKDGAGRRENLPTKEEAFLFAVAEYAAVLDGILPWQYGKCPELLGIGAAAQLTMAAYCGLFAEVSQEESSAIVDGLLCTAIGAAFSLVSISVGLAAESVLTAMSFGTLGVIAGAVISISLYMMFVYGCIALLGGLALTAGACVERWKDRHQSGRGTAWAAAKTYGMEERAENAGNGNVCWEEQEDGTWVSQYQSV